MAVERLVENHTINSDYGPSVGLRKLAGDFESKIAIGRGEQTEDAKSVVNILGMCLRLHETVRIVCDGPDEEAALDAISEYITGSSKIADSAE